MTPTTETRTPAPLPNIPQGKRFHRTVSPSQVDVYKKCPRRWYNASVLYDREPSKGFQLKGDAIHKALEHYGKTGEVLTSVTMHNPVTDLDEEISTFAFVQAAIPHIAPPVTDPYWDEWKGKGPGGSNSAGLMLEQQADMATWAVYAEDKDASGNSITGGRNNIGPNWTQFIDRIEAYPDHGRIIDYKTTSDFRYAKKPAELKEENTQLLANARWLFLNSDYKEVEIGHLYLGTKTKTPKALPVMVTVTREDVEKNWAESLEIVKEMVTWAAMNPPTADPLPPNTSSCGDYGGCYYRDKCGFDSKGASVTQIRPFGEKPPEVSKPLFPITIRPFTRLVPGDGPISQTTETIKPSGATTMEIIPPASPTPPKAGGLLATLMAGKKTAAAATPPVAPSSSPAPLVGLKAPEGATKANPFGIKVNPANVSSPTTHNFGSKNPVPSDAFPGAAPPSATPPASAPASTPPVGLVVPATGSGPAPVKGGGLAALLGKKAPAAAPVPPTTPAAAPVLEASPGQISPPDAASDTSTAEEVAAANPEPEKKDEAALAPAAVDGQNFTEPATEPAPADVPKRRGRPSGARNKTADAVPANERVTVGTLPPGASVAPAAETPTVAETLISDRTTPPYQEIAQADTVVDVTAAEPAPRSAEDEALDGIRERFRTGDPAFPCGTRFLFVDCMPGKGWHAEAPIDLNELMHAFQGTAASTAEKADYRLIKYEQKAYLCMAIRVLMKGLPVAVHVNSNTPGAAEFLAEVTPYAEMIFRGTR